MYWLLSQKARLKKFIQGRFEEGKKVLHWPNKVQLFSSPKNALESKFYFLKV